MGARPNLSEYASKLITHKARQLVGRFGFTRSDRAGLEQDLALHLIEHIDQFDPRRSSQNTFLDRIVNRRIISILRQRFAQRRDCRRNVGLTEAMVDQEDDRLEPVDQRLARVDPSSDLAIDLAHVIEGFDGDTQRMCGVLMHESIAETARQLGLTRAEARTRVARIRKLLTESGLEVYVNEGAAKFNTDGVCNE